MIFIWRFKKKKIYFLNIYLYNIIAFAECLLDFFKLSNK